MVPADAYAMACLVNEGLRQGKTKTSVAGIHYGLSRIALVSITTNAPKLGTVDFVYPEGKFADGIPLQDAWPTSIISGTFRLEKSPDHRSRKFDYNPFTLETSPMLAAAQSFLRFLDSTSTVPKLDNET